jgi:predicted metalloprotease
MRWSAGDSGDIEDRRGSSGRMGGAAPLGIGGVLLLLVLSWATGTNFFTLLDSTSGGSPSQSGESAAPVQESPQERQLAGLVGAVDTDVQNTWARLLGGRYKRTKVVLFRDATETACGVGQAETGPFYCPRDEQVYIDLSFFDELSQRFGAPGDFAEAYVIAHEFGHHVQNLTGVSDRVQGSRSGPNSGSVALELQADCFAGVWAHEASQGTSFEMGKVQLDPNDAEEALRAAAAIGDDRLQKMTTGRVQPERFTHGTSAQRVQWFKTGMESGDPNRCDTFSRSTRQ